MSIFPTLAGAYILGSTLSFQPGSLEVPPTQNPIEPTDIPLTLSGLIEPGTEEGVYKVMLENFVKEIGYDYEVRTGIKLSEPGYRTIKGTIDTLLLSQYDDPPKEGSFTELGNAVQTIKDNPWLVDIMLDTGNNVWDSWIRFVDKHNSNPDNSCIMLDPYRSDPTVYIKGASNFRSDFMKMIQGKGTDATFFTALKNFVTTYYNDTRDIYGAIAWANTEVYRMYDNALVENGGNIYVARRSVENSHWSSVIRHVQMESRRCGEPYEPRFIWDGKEIVQEFSAGSTMAVPKNALVELRPLSDHLTNNSKEPFKVIVTTASGNTFLVDVSNLRVLLRDATKEGFTISFLNDTRATVSLDLFRHPELNKRQATPRIQVRGDLGLVACPRGDFQHHAYEIGDDFVHSTDANRYLTPAERVSISGRYCTSGTRAKLKVTRELPKVQNTQVRVEKSSRPNVPNPNIGR